MSDLAATGGVPGPGRIGRVAIGDLLKRSAQRFPDRTAHVTDGERRDHLRGDRTRRQPLRPTSWFPAGWKPGMKISTICNNSVEMVKALFGIHRATTWSGYQSTPCCRPPTWTTFSITPKVGFALIDDSLHAQPDRRGARGQRGLDRIAVDLAGKAAAAGLAEFNDLLKSQSETEPEVDFDDRDLAMIIYTSGTTSRPKGAMRATWRW